MALSFRLVNFAKSPLQVLTLLMSLAAMQAGEAVANRPNVVWLISEDNAKEAHGLNLGGGRHYYFDL
jgi:hypothetical protein